MKFLQSGFAGMDAPILQDILKIENVHIANASSVYAISNCPLCFLTNSKMEQRIDHHIEYQQSKNWAPIAGDGELTN